MQDKSLKKSARKLKRYAFVAEHRGGPLTKANHRKLMKWAKACSEHVLFLIDMVIDERLTYALNIAEEWANANASTGVAIKASLGAHAVARESKDAVIRAVARSIGQTVATAHMADHSLGGAFYALKAVKLANKELNKEREWQDNKLSELPDELIWIIKKLCAEKEFDKRI